MSEITRITGSFNFGQQVSPPRVAAASVATDGTTIAGDGTETDPLHALGDTETNIQRLSAAGAVNTTDALSIAHATGSGPHAFTLADGTVDGFQKTVCFNPGTVIGADIYRLSAQFSPTPGYTYVSFPQAGGSVTLIWDDTNEWWIIQSTYLGTPTV